MDRKMVIAVVKPWKKREVVSKIKNSADGITLSEVLGYGRQMGRPSLWKRTLYSPDFLPKIEMMFSVDGKNAKDVIRRVIESARTGDIGDGKIFILPVEEELNF